MKGIPELSDFESVHWSVGFFHQFHQIQILCDWPGLPGPPDGTRGEHKVRRAGDYALTVGDVLPHLERGGEAGGIAFFGNHSSNGLLYEILDEDLKLVVNVTMEVLIADFEENAEGPIR